MRFHVTCSLQLASVLLGVISVTAGPLPPDSQHALQRRDADVTIWLGLYNLEEEHYTKLNADKAERQRSDISMGFGSVKLPWVSYPDNNKKLYARERPPTKSYYKERLGLVLRPDFKSVGRKGMKEAHNPILLNHAQLNSHMTDKRIEALQKVGFEYDIQKGKSCVIAALAYFADIGMLVDPEDLLDSAVLEHIIDKLNKVQPPLPPDTSAAALPHDPIVPNPA
ncbi:hypothetical protein FB446DRAFT_725606 [Lentinula raphanica]|nr:hypothetical protein FB446DRAFT_725606 [Lentinula raphanica]